jgi:hypothetical protein
MFSFLCILILFNSRKIIFGNMHFIYVLRGEVEGGGVGDHAVSREMEELGICVS